MLICHLTSYSVSSYHKILHMDSFMAYVQLLSDPANLTVARGCRDKSRCGELFRKK